jgi:hypothetical protein
MFFIAPSKRSIADEPNIGLVMASATAVLTPEGEEAIAEAILVELKADADFGTTGLLLDAKRARQFDSNRRTHETLSSTQVRYTVYEDDAVTVAYVVDFNPLTGAKSVVN